MLKRVLEAIREQVWPERKRLHIEMEITTDDPPPGIPSDRMAEIATMILRDRTPRSGRSSPPGQGTAGRNSETT